MRDRKRRGPGLEVVRDSHGEVLDKRGAPGRQVWSVWSREQDGAELLRRAKALACPRRRAADAGNEADGHRNLLRVGQTVL